MSEVNIMDYLTEVHQEEEHRRQMQTDYLFERINAKPQPAAAAAAARKETVWERILRAIM